ncbi:MAG: twin-arginine translocase TatA/TatE family subunit [Inquilinaceae bacterium]
MSFGPWQLVLILLIVVLLFGAGKIPRLAGDVAKGIKNFKSGMRDEDATASDSNKQIDADGKVAMNTTQKDEATKS